MLPLLSGDRRGGLAVRASTLCAGGRGFDPQLQQTKVFKTGSSGFPPWRSGMWEQYYDWPDSVRITDWLSTGNQNSPGNMDW